MFDFGWDFSVDPVTYCYGEIGCIVVDDSWYDPVNRPINQEPLPREKINTRFILHTRQRPTQVRIILKKFIVGKITMICLFVFNRTPCFTLMI
jgi:hypothetical protein